MFKECDKNKNGTVESDEFILRYETVPRHTALHRSPATHLGPR